MSLNSNVDVRIRAAAVAALDLVNKTAALDYSFTDSLDSGTGADQADVVFSDTRTTDGTGESLDLIGGGLTDHLGATFAPTKIKLLFVYAAAANTANVVVTTKDGEGVPFLTPISGEDPNVVIKPGGFAMFYGPVVGAHCSVTATTADKINVKASTGTVSYSIIIVGTSA